MRKVFVLLSASLVMSLALAPAAGAQATFPESDGSGDTIGDGCPAGQFAAIPPNTLGEGGFDCFATQEQADNYAETGQQPTQTTPPSNAETPRIERPRNCDEFGGSQAAAQDFLENVTPDDQFNLDPDNDGIACEGLLPNGQEGAEASGSASSAAGEQYEEATGDTSDTEEITTLPDTSGPPLLALGAGTALLLATGGLLMKRQIA